MVALVSGRLVCPPLRSRILEKGQVWVGDGGMVVHFAYAELGVGGCGSVYGMWVWSQERGCGWGYGLITLSVQGNVREKELAEETKKPHILLSDQTGLLFSPVFLAIGLRHATSFLSWMLAWPILTPQRFCSQREVVIPLQIPEDNQLAPLSYLSIYF